MPRSCGVGGAKGEDMKEYNILHLGAGIQSSTIYCLMVDGEIAAADYALFADTQDEPAWVYKQLAWLESLGGPPIHPRHCRKNW